MFDKVCQSNNIPVLHPYNFGWAGFLTVTKPDTIQLDVLTQKPHGFELEMAKYVAGYETHWYTPQAWLDNVIEQYKNENGILPPPQLSIGSWIAAGYCVNVMYNLVMGKEVKCFPKFYLSSVLYDIN